MSENRKILFLEEENAKLKNQLQKLNKQNKIKNEIFIQQSKMASVGEMIHNIAHQWRQPLMEIAALLMHIEAKITLDGSVSNKETLATLSKSNHIIQFMSETIEDFRNFFATDKQKEMFIVAEKISMVLNIMRLSLSMHTIKIQVIIKDNLKIFGLKNEFGQVLINILSNAKDAIVARGIANGKIVIKLYKKEENSIIEIEDNAGGIDLQPLEKVFEPFFTYKKKNGTGIGLFMSKLIIENSMNGKLSVQNKAEGACFQISL